MRKYRPVKFEANEINVDDQIRVDGLLYWVNEKTANKDKGTVTLKCEHATRHAIRKTFTFKTNEEVKVRCVNPDYKAPSKPASPKATQPKARKPAKPSSGNAVAAAAA